MTNETPNLAQPNIADANSEQSDRAHVAAPERLKIFHLQFTEAQAISESLDKLFGNRSCKIVAERRTNTVIVRGEGEILEEIEALLLRLDQEPTSEPRRNLETFAAANDVPEAKKLLEKLRVQESAAATEADRVRKLQEAEQAESNKPPLAEHQAVLKQLIGTAFDLKLQLEELQVKELQSRLSQLERRIGQRKGLREQIIERRSRELIEGDALRWNTTRPNTAIDDTKTSFSSAPKAPGSESTEQATKTTTLATQIGFVGPEGTQIFIVEGVRVIAVRAVHDFRRDVKEIKHYDLQFNVQSNGENIKFSGRLDIYPVNESTDSFLIHNRVPLSITDADIQQVHSNSTRVKVAYFALPSAKRREPGIEILDSSKLETGTDPIREAGWRGAVLAVLRLGPGIVTPSTGGDLMPKRSK